MPERRVSNCYVVAGRDIAIEKLGSTCLEGIRVNRLARVGIEDPNVASIRYNGDWRSYGKYQPGVGENLELVVPRENEMRSFGLRD